MPKLPTSQSKSPFNFWTSLTKLVGGTLLVGVLLIFGYYYGQEVRPPGTGTISVSDAKVCLEKGADIYFNVTLGTQSYLKHFGEWKNTQHRSDAQAFVISANTHKGNIRNLSIEGALFLKVDGIIYPASDRPVGSSKHHNTYLVYFPARGMTGEALFKQSTGSFDILIENVGGLKHRVFTFHHPLPTEANASKLSLGQILMLLGAVIAALLISCTPCLIGSLAVGSVTIGTAWTEEDKMTAEMVRKEMMRRTIYFLLATSGAYLAMVILINQFGVTLEDLRPIQVIGALILIGIGAMMLHDLKPVATFSAWVRHLMGDDEEISGSSVGTGSSTAMGGSLAMLCSVAGAPTLTTSIVLPVMVYAGFTSFAWALTIMLIFLLVSILPFFFVAMGLGELLYALSTRWRKTLLAVNAALLFTVGFIMIFEGDKVVDYISIPADLMLRGFKWIFG